MTPDGADLGDALGGDFVVERELGGGGMSRVFLAREVALARRVVIKVLPPELAAGVSTERFRREILLAARLQHPHIVPLLSAGELRDGTLYFTMPYVEGESLRARFQRERPPVDQVVRWLRDIASALSHAHANNVVHRDMKPDNVLLSGGYAMVADFGIAKALSSATEGHGTGTLTSMGVSLGTPAYMAPEQALGDIDVDHRADIYALGVIAYELLAGRTPFDGRSLRAILTAHVMTPPEPLRSHRPDIVPELGDLVMRCLAKEPIDRPQSAFEVESVLENVLRAPATGGAVRLSAATSAVATTVGPPPVPHEGRRRVVAIALGISVVVAVVTAAAVVVRRNGDAPPIASRIVVASFRDASLDSSLRAVARTVADDITAELSAIDSVETVGREEIERVESSLSAGEQRPRVLATKLRAALVITGSVAPLGADSVRIAARLVDATTGRIIRDMSEARAPRSDLRGGLAALRTRLASAVLVVTNPMFGQGMLPGGDPPALTAILAVRDGLQLEAALRSADPGEDESLAELVRFDRAVAEDPDFLQGRLWFASAALRRFGGEALADSALALVEARQDRLTTYEHALLDALRADAGGNHEMALRGWRRAHELAPSWPNQWWLAMKLRDANRPRESLVQLDSLGAVTAHFLRSTPAVYHYVGDHSAEYRALAAEGRRAPSTVNSLGYQESFVQALAALDSVATIGRRWGELEALPAEAGTSAAHLFSRIAWELTAHGHAGAGDSTLQRGVDWCRSRTALDFRKPALVFDCIEVYGLAGHAADVAALAGPALVSAPGDVSLLGLLGLTAALRGDRPLATSFAARVEHSVRVDGSRGLAWWERARIAAALGDSAAAVDLLRDAFARGAGWAQRFDLHRDPAFTKLRGYPPFERLRAPQG